MGGPSTDAQWTSPVTPSSSGGLSVAVVVAGVWSLAAAVAGLAWTIDPATYPFGPNDPVPALSVLGAVPPTASALLVLVVGLLGLVVAAVIGRVGARAPAPLLARAYAAPLAVLLLLVVPDYRLLAAVAYGFVAVVAVPIGLVSLADYVAALTPVVVAEALALVGGLAWGIVAVRHWGSPPTPRSPTDGARSWLASPRAGRVLTGLAVAVPLVYAATRWAWALGIPLGLSAELYGFGQSIGLWAAGAALGVVAAIGALLTLGLATRWGERFPAWLPAIGGRAVPVPLAVVPPLLVAALVTSAGLMFWRLMLAGTLDDVFSWLGPADRNWAALAPELLWPIWGAALAGSAAAYAARRRRRPRSRDRAGGRPPAYRA